MKKLSGLLLILFLSCGDSKPKIDKQILDVGVFTIETPNNWRSKIGYGTFSAEVGQIIINNQDTLTFDISRFANSLTETDSTIIQQYKIPTFNTSTNIDSIKLIDIDKYRKNNISWDTVDGQKAKIVYPRQPGIGTTGIYFEKIGDDYNSLVLYGENINPVNENLLLQAFKTIKFRKKK